MPCTVLDGERNRDDVVSEELLMQEIEWFALEWLGVVVGNHFVGRAVLDFDVSFFNLVGQIKITNVRAQVRLVELLLPFSNRRIVLLLSW